MTRYVKSSDIGEGVFTKYNKDQNYATWKRAEDLILTAVGKNTYIWGFTQPIDYISVLTCLLCYSD